MPNYYPKIINCKICGAERETKGGAIYCLKCAKAIKKAQIKEHLAGRPTPVITKIKVCVECGEHFALRGKSKVCGEGCLYASQVKQYGEKKARFWASDRRVHIKQKVEICPTKIEIPPMRIQGMSIEHRERYFKRVV